MLAGRLTGTLDGRPVVIEAGESGILLTVSSFRTAWAARRTVGSLFAVLKMLKRSGVPLRLGVAGLVTVEVLPRPGALARIFAPSLSRLA
jgi:hypothetical protein